MLHIRRLGSFFFCGICFSVFRGLNVVHVVLAHDEAWRFSMVPELLQQGVVIWNCGDWSLCLSCAHDFYALCVASLFPDRDKRL